MVRKVRGPLVVVKEIARDYLADGGADLIEREADFLSVGLVYGRIRAYVVMGRPPLPVLVAEDSARRLPISSIGNARASG